MPSGVRETASSRGFPVDSLGINSGRHFPPRTLIGSSFATGESSKPDRWWHVGLKDFQFLGRARAEIHFGGLDVRMTEPGEIFLDAGELTVRINAESMLRNLA